MHIHYDTSDTDNAEALQFAMDELPEPLDYWELEDFDDIVPPEH